MVHRRTRTRILVLYVRVHRTTARPNRELVLRSFVKETKGRKGKKRVPAFQISQTNKKPVKISNPCDNRRGENSRDFDIFPLFPMVIYAKLGTWYLKFRVGTLLHPSSVISHRSDRFKL